MCPLRWYTGYFIFRNFFFIGLSFLIKLVPTLFWFGPAVVSIGVVLSSGSPVNLVLKVLPCVIVPKVFFMVLSIYLSSTVTKRYSEILFRVRLVNYLT